MWCMGLFSLASLARAKPLLPGELCNGFGQIGKADQDRICECDIPRFVPDENGKCICNGLDHWIESADKNTCDCKRGFKLLDSGCICGDGKVDKHGECVTQLVAKRGSKFFKKMENIRATAVAKMKKIKQAKTLEATRAAIEKSVATEKKMEQMKLNKKIKDTTADLEKLKQRQAETDPQQLRSRAKLRNRLGKVAHHHIIDSSKRKAFPTTAPTAQPTKAPTEAPTGAPTGAPTDVPSGSPSKGRRSNASPANSASEAGAAKLPSAQASAAAEVNEIPNMEAKLVEIKKLKVRLL
jgi:hypothetical protein